MTPLDWVLIGLVVIAVWIITLLFGHDCDWINRIHDRNMNVFAEITAHLLLFTVAPLLYIIYALEWFFKPNVRKENK